LEVSPYSLENMHQAEEESFDQELSYYGRDETNENAQED